VVRWLIAVDGSPHSDRAVDCALQLARNCREPVEVHVLNVQPPITFGDVKRHVGQEALNAYYHEEGLKALASARRRLDSSAIAHTYHIGVGPVAETIAEYAREHACAQIIMGTRGLGTISNLVLGSVAAKVLHLATVAVTLVK
jgi:nucleotide-binding universal stress UspA family protein